MTPIKTAQLLRELAAHIDDLADHSDPFYSDLVDRARAAAEAIEKEAKLIASLHDARARAAAEEIEARKVPTDDEIIECYSQAAADYIDTLESLATERDQFDAKAYGLRAVITRFGGGEVGK